MEPPNDNRTEQWLQAYARLRREDSGEAEEMHEATRRMLLGEAQREWGTAEKKKEPVEVESPWMRWAWVGTVAVAAAVVFVISRPSRSTSPGTGGTMEIAQNNQPTPTANDNLADAKFNQAGLKEDLVPIDKNPNQDRQNRAALHRATSPSLATVPAQSAPGALLPPSAPRPKELGVPDGGGVVGELSTARSTATFQAVPIPGKGDFYAGPKNLRQNFVRHLKKEGLTRNVPPVPEAKAADKVLRNFKFERNGQSVRVVDSYDGSVYRGQAQLAPSRKLKDLEQDKQKKEEAPPKAKSQPAALAESGQVPQLFYFSVAGTNKTLNLRVVFEGEFQDELLKSTAAKAAGFKRKEKASAVTKAIRARVPAPQLRIQGCAQVGRLSYGVDARNQLPVLRPAIRK